MSNWGVPSGALPWFEVSEGLLIPVNLASRLDLEEPASEDDDENSIFRYGVMCVCLMRLCPDASGRQGEQSTPICHRTTICHKTTIVAVRCLHYEKRNMAKKRLSLKL